MVLFRSSIARSPRTPHFPLRPRCNDPYAPLKEVHLPLAGFTNQLHSGLLDQPLCDFGTLPVAVAAAHLAPPSWVVPASVPAGLAGFGMYDPRIPVDCGALSVRIGCIVTLLLLLLSHAKTSVTSP